MLAILIGGAAADQRRAAVATDLALVAGLARGLSTGDDARACACAAVLEISGADFVLLVEPGEDREPIVVASAGPAGLPGGGVLAALGAEAASLEPLASTARTCWRGSTSWPRRDELTGAGDRLLKTAAAAWVSELGDAGTIGRYGGDEFVVILPGLAGEAAAAATEMLRWVVPDGTTCSAGVASWDGEQSAAQLIAGADALLYAAKEGGRDRTAASVPHDLSLG